MTDARLSAVGNAAGVAERNQDIALGNDPSLAAQSLLDSFKEFAAPQLTGYVLGAALGAYVNEARAIYAAIKAESTIAAPVTSEGAASPATLPNLRTQLDVENLANIAKLDPRLAAAINGSGKSNPNFAIGSATETEAEQLGKIWVGDGARLTANQNACPGCLISADGTRIYRPPQAKSSPQAITGVQANFVKQTTTGVLTSNGHLNINR